MEFDQLATLMSVLHHGSFTRAAEVLGLSQSTVSFHIKALEQTVGTKLIDRGREGVSATPHGRMLRRYAAQLLAMRGEAEASLQALDDGLVGHVTVAASTIPGEYLLPPALAKLRGSHPGVSVSLQVSDSRRAVADLVSGETDLAVVGSSPRDRRVELRPFANDEIVAVAAASARVRLRATDDLSEVPLVLRHEGSGTRAAVADVLAAGLRGKERGAIIEVGSTESLKRCVLAGLGVGFLSRVAIATELERGQLQVIELAGTPVRREFFIALRKGPTLSPAAAALVEILAGDES